MFIVHLGFSGFPKGMASVQRTFFTFKGLKEAGATPLIINKISHHQDSDNKKIKIFEGIPYVNTSYYNSKPISFLNRNINKLSGYFGELKLLFKKRKKIDTAILYSSYFLEYPYYYILSRIFGFKIIIQYVEMFSSIPGRNSFFTKINDKLIDRYICSFCDGVVPISDFLVKHIQSIEPNKPLLKIPANSDFSKVDNISQSLSGNYLMYCGTINYEEIIEFVISLYVKLKENNKYTGGLLLIISGDNGDSWSKLRSFIKNTSFQQDIVIKSNIPYSELLMHYNAADILMIPLRNTTQDIARFPHKIAEYTAAKRPILSTNLGELKYYFTDGVSAILADTYNLQVYYDKLSVVLSSRQTLDRIGLEGHNTGLRNFDYRMQGKQLKVFIDRL